MRRVPVQGNVRSATYDQVIVTIDSRTPDRSLADQQPAQPAPRVERPSTLQIVASALAAMTTTALLATLGVAGTIIGAALASVITVLANFVYTASISRTADKVVATVPVKKTRAQEQTEVTAAREPAVTILVDGEPVLVEGAVTAPSADTAAGAQRPGALRSVVDRFGWPRIGGAIAVVFVLVLGAVTVVELTAGKPLTDVVRNQEGSGTSLFGTRTDSPSVPVEKDAPGTEPDGVPAPAPEESATPEPTEAPSEAPTQEAPAPMAPPEGETPEDSPATPAPSEEPSQEPGDDVAPGAAPQPAPDPTPAPTPSR